MTRDELVALLFDDSGVKHAIISAVNYGVTSGLVRLPQAAQPLVQLRPDEDPPGPHRTRQGEQASSTEKTGPARPPWPKSEG